MGELVIFTSATGGAGKTILTAGIGAALAARGYSVLLLDACPGKPSLDMSTGVSRSVIYDFADALEGTCLISDSIRKVPGIPGLYLVPAPKNRTAAEIPAEKFRKLLGLFTEKFDFVCADMEYGKTGFQEALLDQASRIIAVVTANAACMRNTKRLLGALPGDMERSAVINMVRTELMKSGEVLTIEDVVAELGIPLLGAVKFDTELMLRNEDGSPVTDVREPAGRAFANIAGRILGEDIPVNLREKH